MADINIVRATSANDLGGLYDLQKSAWGFDDKSLIPDHLISATIKRGGITLIAKKDGQSLGFSFAFLAKEQGKIHLHLHAIGVHSKHKHKGIGEALLERLRDEATEEGHEMITWTFDPLIGPNANLYIRKVGATVSEYDINVYGSDINNVKGGIPSDRFIAKLDLTKRHMPIITRKDMPCIKIGEDIPPSSPFAIEVQLGFNTISQIDKDKACQMRLESRKCFLKIFEQGCSVVGFVSENKDGRRRNFYILEQ